jgi:flagellar biosynthesis/type III secretory pathway protein FliH
MPAAAEQEVLHIIEQWEEEQAVPYVTHIERMAIERGLERGRAEGREEGQREGREEGQREEAARAVRRVLARRFGAAATMLDEQIVGIADLARLEAILDQAITATSLDDLHPLLEGTQD